MTTALDVAHLWRRAAFGISPDGADDRAGRSWTTLVSELVDAEPRPLFRPTELDDPTKSNWERSYRVIEVWLNHMATTSAPGAEKLALFWHGHFTTSVEKIDHGERIWDQLDFLRTRAHGYFRNLLGGIVKDPAMLVYLDNVYNTKWNINENLARELLELFTIGIGNYTQTDVREAARCLTGQSVDWDNELAFKYYPDWHDNGVKHVLHRSGNYGPTALCDILCNSENAPRVARHVVRRMWTQWAYGDPSTTLVNEIAAKVVADGLTGKAFMRAVLLHPEFRSTRARSALVRTPTEVAVALMKTTGIKAQDMGVEWILREVGHCPYLPPNVSGWPRSWMLMTTSTWWGLGGMHWDAAWTASGRNPLKMPDTRQHTPTEAAKRMLTYARITGPSAEQVAQIASVISRVRSQVDPRSERAAAHLAVTLSPAFGRN